MILKNKFTCAFCSYKITPGEQIGTQKGSWCGNSSCPLFFRLLSDNTPYARALLKQSGKLYEKI